MTVEIMDIIPVETIGIVLNIMSMSAPPFGIATTGIRTDFTTMDIIGIATDRIGIGIDTMSMAQNLTTNRKVKNVLRPL